MIRTPALLLVLAAAFLAQTPDDQEVRAHEDAPSFRIRVDTNLVNVPVVVRDTSGHPVPSLEKKDFRILDNGKPQEISGFRVETTLQARETKPPVSDKTPPLNSTPVAPHRFVGLFFDDLHMDIEEVTRLRKASIRYLTTSVDPDARVGLFTSSGTNATDFTSDRQKLEESIGKIAPRSRTIPTASQCPSIDEYQAYLIASAQDTSALDIATAEGYECHCKGGNDTPECADDQRRMARGEASQIWDLADLQSQYSVLAIQNVIQKMAALAGQRSLVLVSPGFLTMTRNHDVDTLINQALARNVVINAIDASGLYTKILHERPLASHPEMDVQKRGIENEKLSIQRDVLAGLTAGTGGTYFQNSNDFDEGFRETAQSPEVYYILSFSPQNVKLDGSIHKLKVSVDIRGPVRVEARRSYFAQKPSPAGAGPPPSELEKILFSLDELHGLPVEVTAKQERVGDRTDVMVHIHVDVRSLQLRKEGDRSLDTLMFATALFDSDGKYVTSKEASLDLRLKDANMDRYLQYGVNAVTKFAVSAGTYRVREIVRDTQSHDLAAVNCTVQVLP